MNNKKDENFVRIAIEEAENALNEGNSPYGAILVKDDKIIARAHNTTTTDNNPTAHAEINVIRKLSKELDAKNLEGYTLYSNVEPCPMCAAACIWAGISRIVFGASIQDVMKSERYQTGKYQIKMSCKEVIDAGFKNIEVISGVLKEESLKLFQSVRIR